MEDKKEYWTEEEIQDYINKIENTKKRYMEVDLHNHTTGSDGTQSPLLLLLRASNKGKNIVSITDHDSVEGYTILTRQITEKLAQLENLKDRKDLSVEEKEKITLGIKRLLKVLENIKILPSAELITSYKGCIVEVLAYASDIKKLSSEIQKIHEGLVPGSKLLTEGVDRVIKENDINIDTFVIENRSDFKKLFFHELRKHTENDMFFNNLDGQNEDAIYEEFVKKYFDDEKSPFYIDMNDNRKVKEIRKDFLRIIDTMTQSGIINFDRKVIEYSHAVTGEFFNELKKHPENLPLIPNINTLKEFINKHLYNSRSPFFIDMSSSRPSIKDTVNAIHNAGGKAIIAHIGRYNDKFDVKKEIQQGNILEGIDGIEIFYPDHDEEFQEFLLNVCREKELLASGGSDDHFAPKDGEQYKMGTVNIPDIPETEWIKEYIQTGGDYIKKSEEIYNSIKEIRNIKETLDNEKIEEDNIR